MIFNNLLYVLSFVIFNTCAHYGFPYWLARELATILRQVHVLIDEAIAESGMKKISQFSGVVVAAVGTDLFWVCGH